jgi:hypothetical protein
MADQTPGMASRQPVVEQSDGGGAATGFAVFAGVLMIVAGAYEAFVGLVALFSNSFYLRTNSYVFKFDITGWGWVHVLIALVILAAGVGVLYGQLWARTVGIVVAGVSALANFLFIPYYPIWALAIIALDDVVIWALTNYRGLSY